MKIMSKYLLKNILSKPLRTLVLIVCICSCSFVALASMDVVGSMEVILKTMLTQITGTADIIVMDEVGINEEFDIPYETDQLLVWETQNGTVEIPEGFYNYFHKKDFSVATMDYSKAYKMRLMAEDLKLADDEIVISKKLAKEQGWEAGDTITLFDEMNNERKLKVVSILPNAGYPNGKAVALVNKDVFTKFSSKAMATSIYVDAIDDTQSVEIKNAIEDVDYNCHAQVLIDSDENKEMMQQLSLILFMIFMVCFLLVIFVAVSVSNRIVCERMAVVGTFRSLGLSPAFCTRILLMENALYGLIGSISGVVIYSIARTPILNSIFSVTSEGVEVHLELNNLSIASIIGVSLLGIIIMCACPLKEIIRTSKIAIRDIIFDNKDTAYKMNKVSNIIGIACLVIGIGTFFIRTSMLAQILCFTCWVVAIALLFPIVLKAVMSLIGKLLDSINMPIAHMATMESYSRKSTVGSSVLCVTTSVLAVIIFIFVSTLGGIYDVKTYDCDVHTKINQEMSEARYSYIADLEGVSETEFIYSYNTQIKVNDEKKDGTVIALNDGGYKLFSAIKDYPASLDNNSILTTATFAKRNGIEIGDMVDITFDANSYLPITKTLKLAGYVDAYNYDTTQNIYVISKDLYVDMYHNRIGEMLINCEDSEAVIAQIEKYSGTQIESVETVEAYNQEWKDRKNGMKGLMYMVIALGVGLTLVGMISNQIIGFEGRKRECAVLVSTAMTRGKLAKMFLLESAFAAFASLVVALPIALLAFEPFKVILENADAEINVVYNPIAYMMFLVLLWVVFTFVAIFPIRSLRKMNIAAQLKYE